MNAATVVRWLGGTWWAIFPAFTLLTLRLGRERACADPYDLLPALAANPTTAWPIALVYLLMHVWIAGAYLTTAARADSVVPPIGAWREAWRGHAFKVLLTLVALAIEYAPMPLWRWLGRLVLCPLGSDPS